MNIKNNAGSIDFASAKLRSLMFYLRRGVIPYAVEVTKTLQDTCSKKVILC